MARSSDFNFQIKGTARQAVTGHLGTTIGSILFYCITALLLSNITVSIFPGSDVGSTIGFEAVNFIIQLFLGLLAYGINYQHLLLVYGQNTTFGDLFAGFRRGVNDRVIKVTAVLALISFCCTLPATLVMSTCADAAEMIEKMYLIAPLYIAGIILDIWFTLSFSQCYYLLADFETLGAKDCLRDSARMMKGNRGRLFVLILSFLPLALLGLLSFGIADLWTASYETAAEASFYQWLTASGRKDSDQ